MRIQYHKTSGTTWDIVVVSPTLADSITVGTVEKKRFANPHPSLGYAIAIGEHYANVERPQDIDHEVSVILFHLVQSCFVSS